MLTFQKFIQLSEAKSEETGTSKTAVFAFGRFNPPTRGHEKIVNTVLKVAADRGGDPFIFTSHSQDPKKNPMEYDTKIGFMRAVFPNVTVVHDEQQSGVTGPIRTVFHVAGFLNDMGYTDIVLVAGSDRIPEYQRMFNKSEEFYDSFEVVSAGERDPDAEGASGMSATKAREAAASGDIGKFRAATGWEGDIAAKMMNAVRAGMGVN